MNFFTRLLLCLLAIGAGASTQTAEGWPIDWVAHGKDFLMKGARLASWAKRRLLNETLEENAPEISKLSLNEKKLLEKNQAYRNALSWLEWPKIRAILKKFLEIKDDAAFKALEEADKINLLTVISNAPTITITPGILTEAKKLKEAKKDFLPIGSFDDVINEKYLEELLKRNKKYAEYHNKNRNKKESYLKNNNRVTNKIMENEIPQTYVMKKETSRNELSQKAYNAIKEDKKTLLLEPNNRVTDKINEIPQAYVEQKETSGNKLSQKAHKAIEWVKEHLSHMDAKELMPEAHAYVENPSPEKDTTRLLAELDSQKELKQLQENPLYSKNFSAAVDLTQNPSKDAMKSFLDSAVSEDGGYIRLSQLHWANQLENEFRPLFDQIIHQAQSNNPHVLADLNLLAALWNTPFFGKYVVSTYEYLENLKNGKMEENNRLLPLLWYVKGLSRI